MHHFISVLVAAVLVLAFSLSVLADQQQVDNDLAESGNQNIVTLSSAPGETVNTFGQIVINYSGGTHLSAGEIVTFTVISEQTDLPSGYTVSDVELTVPGSWGSGGQVAGTSVVSFTAPTETGSHVYDVKWTTTINYGNKLTGAPALVIYLDVVALDVGETESTECDDPIITITTPGDGARYILNQTVRADWIVENGGCGIASVDAPAESGYPINTSSVGAKDFIVSATDDYDNSASLSHTYYVDYNFGGFLPPLGPGPKEFKAGSTIPVKFQLSDFDGNIVDNASGTASIASVSASIRYDASAEQYIANLKTTKGVTGTYNLTVNLNDGTTKTISVVLK